MNQESAVGPGETAGPHPRGWVMTLRDHTEIEHLSGELASMRTMSDALRSQTHEFANRLHTIVSLIELDRAGGGARPRGAGTRSESAVDRPRARGGA